MTVPPRCLEPKWMTQFPEVSALGLGGFVFGNGDKLGAAVRGLRNRLGCWCFWCVSELVMVTWLGWIGYSEWLLQWFEVVVFCLWRFFLLLGGGLGFSLSFLFPPRISDKKSQFGGPVDVAIFFWSTQMHLQNPQGFTDVTWGIFHPPFESLDSPHFFCGWSWDVINILS